MDFKVYKKEEVKQPSGSEYLVVPDIVDLIPITDGDVITGFEQIDDTDETEQQCAMAVIWQKGLDPLTLEDGISWSQAILGEVTIIQIMEELIATVEDITSTIKVEFDTVTTADNKEFFSFTLKGVY